MLYFSPQSLGFSPIVIYMYVHVSMFDFVYFSLYNIFYLISEIKTTTTMEAKILNSELLFMLVIGHYFVLVIAILQVTTVTSGGAMAPSGALMAVQQISKEAEKQRSHTQGWSLS